MKVSEKELFKKSKKKKKYKIEKSKYKLYSIEHFSLYIL